VGITWQKGKSRLLANSFWATSLLSNGVYPYNRVRISTSIRRQTRRAKRASCIKSCAPIIFWKHKMTDTPNEIFDFVIVKHFGLICLILAVIFSGVQKLYSLFRVRKHPELKDGYPQLILGFLIFIGLPWLIIAIGELIYNVSGVLFLFALKDGNLFSWLFYTLLICEYIFLIFWVWFVGGGEYLHKYQLMSYEFSSPLAAKIFVTLVVFGGTLFVFFMGFSI
jgi:hypothetical protein